MNSPPNLYQINASGGGVPKHSVPEAWISVEGIQEDGHRNKVLHGGPDRAICIYSFELIQALQKEGHIMHPGALGENFTLTGLDWSHIQPGDQLKVGEQVCIELTSFCEPCRRIKRWFYEGDFHRIDQRKHPGWSRLYARVLFEGQVRQGDPVWVETLSGSR